MSPAPLLVLDFDGVICDSVDECFTSSWTAYHELHLGLSPSPPDPAARQAFAVLRPFVRSGEDFVLIQEILARGESVDDQAGFDERARRGGHAVRSRYRELFYQARAELLGRDPAAWLALNHVYPHVAAGLSRLRAATALFILSTKKPAFIAEILAANRIRIPVERIVWSDAEPKLAAVARLRAASARDRAVFIEDQVDAIAGNADPAITVYLATWGYVKAEWLGPHAVVPLITPEGFLDLMEREFAGP